MARALVQACCVTQWATHSDVVGVIISLIQLVSSEPWTLLLMHKLRSEFPKISCDEFGRSAATCLLLEAPESVRRQAEVTIALTSYISFQIR